MNQRTDENISPIKTKLAYSGICNDEITIRLIEIFSEHKNSNLTRTTQKRIPYLIAECFQNIIRHGIKDVIDGELKAHECFEVELSDNDLNIVSTNLLLNSDVEGLSHQLKIINNSSQEELKAMRFDIISNGKLSEKGGAGLGLIELARKSENSILHSITQINDEYSTVTFGIRMDLTEQAKERSLETFNNRKPVCIKNAVLYYKGILGKRIKTHIQSIISENFKQSEGDREINWIDRVTSLFGNSDNKDKNDEQGVVEMMFKKIQQNIDFEANKKFIRNQLGHLQNLANELKLEGNFSVQELDDTYSLATVSIRA